MNGTDSSGSGTAEPLDVVPRTDRLLDHGADVLDQLDVHAHAEQRQHDVREHHGRVDVVPAHRLQRHLGAELGLVADLEERVRLPDLAVLRQRAARLAHEPDRRALGRLAARRADEKGLAHRRSRLAAAMERVGEHPVPAGPLAVRWLGYRLPAFRAGARGRRARWCSQNAGTATWRSRGELGVKLSYHWLDDRGNPIVWDGPRDRLRRPRPAGRRGRGRAARARAAAAGPLPARVRPRRGAPLLVRRGRLPRARAGRRGAAADRRAATRRRVRGGADAETTAALAAQEEPLVEEDAVAVAHLVAGAVPAPDWSRRDARRARRGLRRRRRLDRDAASAALAALGARAAAATRPSRIPLLLPSLLAGLEPGEHEGLPAYVPGGEPRSSTAGSDFDCHAVVDAREDERAERERDHGGRRSGRPRPPAAGGSP